METVALADGDLRWVFPELAGRLRARWTTNIPESAHGTSVDAANALLAAVTWLLRRGAEEPAGAWRGRGPGC